MGKLGMLGAMGGAGNALSETGKMMFGDHLETVRQERMAEIQGKRDEKLFGQKKEMSDIEQSQKKELKGIDIDQKNIELDVKSEENELDRKNRIEVATISADARKQAAADKAKAEAGGGKPSTSFKQYNELVSGQLGGIKYPQDWAVGIAYGGHKTTTDPKTKEMILLGPDSNEPSGFKEVGRMVPSDPNKRRSPKVWESKEEPESTGGLLSDSASPDAPATAMPSPTEYAKVKTDPGKKYKDGDYGKYKVVNGEVYMKKQ